MNRPTGVTVAGWLLVAAGGMVIASLPFRLANPEFESMQRSFGWTLSLALALVSVTAVVNLVAGTAILNERNWGRLLYLWFTPAALFLEWAFLRGQTDVCSSWWEIALYVVSFVLLTRPDAQAWFGAPLHPPPEHHGWPLRSGWVLMGAAGALLAALATLVWGIGLCAYAAGSYTEGFSAALRDPFPRYVLPALATAPLVGALLGLGFARRPPTVLATPLLAATAAVFNHGFIYTAMLVAAFSHGPLRGAAGHAAMLPLIGVFLGATAAPLWIPGAFLLRSIALRLPRVP